MIIKPQVTGSILTKRGINQITRVANRVGALEIRDRLPNHFKRSAYTEYGYQPRKKGYEIRKAKQTKQNAPLVFHGDLRRAVLSSAKVTATSKRGRVQARGSRSSNLRTQYQKEIEVVSNREQRETADNWVDTYTELATDVRYHNKINVKT